MGIIVAEIIMWKLQLLNNFAYESSYTGVNREEA